MTNIYVIYGESGEILDQIWWIVEAVSTEERAQQRVLELEELIRDLFDSLHHERWKEKSVSSEYWQKVGERMQMMKEHPKGDPHIEALDGDVRYTYQAVCLRD